ncbi:DUF4861 domain-containing protein [Bacteroidia bacterium]|nr:DUF4861 domain-containing protein [Bacteroidia bacterium]
MKRIFFLLAATALLTSCSNKGAVEIIVENTLGFDRSGEMVEACTEETNIDFNAKTYVLKDGQGVETAYQLLSNGKGTFIFQANVPANSSVTYTLTEGTPAPVAPKTNARFVPERKDDFSWENDLAAYRMYGPALARENPSNGVDIWLKCTEGLIADSLYAGELERHVSYHENRGFGLDCYDVKHTAGAGGIAPYTDKFWVGDRYDRYEVIENGPLRSVFTLSYDSAIVEGEVFRETITITADAGSMLNKGVVRYTGPAKPIKLAAGLTLHKERGQTFSDAAHKVIGYAENAVSEIKRIPQGRSYVGAYMPEATGETPEDGTHLLILGNYTVGTDFTYYFGGGWSQWKFPTDADWFNGLKHFSQAKEAPLKVTVLTGGFASDFKAGYNAAGGNKK